MVGRTEESFDQVSKDISMTLTELTDLLNNRKALSPEDVDSIIERLRATSEREELADIRSNARLKEFMDRTYTL